ncbi:hypothetical protein HCN44_007204 [Aphidius gifuensis]|uniref:DDE Tnp4 domain-containing protein n=1 Tax=Aphidius gifuensis TaxID=684658 RepID=A0A835CMX0_APHGI|nr:hypothetical protein HCN44_007204 [Aphidius gifuensis]
MLGKTFCTITPTQFEYIVNLIAALVECHRVTIARKPISCAERLCVLRVSGDTQISIASQYNMGTSTPIVLSPPISEDLKKKANGFGKFWHFQHCIGAIDGRHIHIEAPPNASSQYYIYKGYHNIVVLAICDH